MLPFITLDGLTCRTPDGRTLFENLNLAIAGERTGLVGRNGCGKTTLLRLMLGEIAPAAGAVTRRGGIALLRQIRRPQIPQTMPGARLSDLLEVGEALDRLERLERGDGNEDDLNAADWELPGRIEATLSQVGLTGFEISRPAASLSGGEATRAELARVMIAQPDVLLLDEPTNNLDRAARELVFQVLESWRGGAVVVSHDRRLLRRMDRIVELGGLGVRVYGGGYDLYAARRAEEEAAAAQGLEVAAREARQVEREIQTARERKARRDAAGHRARAKGDQPKMLLDARAERAEVSGGRQTALAERQRAQVLRDLQTARARVEEVRRLNFELPPSGLAAGKLVLAFDQVGFCWPDGAPVLSDFSVRLTGPERLAVTGDNGKGKTTLIRLAIGELAPSAGRITRGVPSVVLDQHVAVLADDLSLLDNFRRLNPQVDDNSAHAALARFLFRNAAAFKLARDLSGGERLRAALACVLMAARPPQLIILDEPTNHLDLDSITAIEAALRAYDGALLVVSHDEDFLQAIGTEGRIRLSL
ncbi:MAG TPA: ABC-F family ATP-binding cassette domain-containing protein [Caulobacteraceae bacterium]|jgi:ATPase subunit of ABC transporter with duplicated ATPase domains